MTGGRWGEDVNPEWNELIEEHSNHAFIKTTEGLYLVRKKE